MNRSVETKEDGWVEIVTHIERKCDLRGKTVPAHSSYRVSYPFIDNLTCINQNGEPTLDCGKADFNVLDMACKHVSRAVVVTPALEAEKVRLVTETTTLIQWSILWPEGEPRPRNW